MLNKHARSLAKGRIVKEDQITLAMKVIPTAVSSQEMGIVHTIPISGTARRTIKAPIDKYSTDIKTIPPPDSRLVDVVIRQFQIKRSPSTTNIVYA
jgi:hypothetical protein